MWSVQLLKVAAVCPIKPNQNELVTFSYVWSFFCFFFLAFNRFVVCHICQISKSFVLNNRCLNEFRILIKWFTHNACELTFLYFVSHSSAIVRPFLVMFIRLLLWMLECTQLVGTNAVMSVSIQVTTHILVCKSKVTQMKQFE